MTQGGYSCRESKTIIPTGVMCITPLLLNYPTHDQGNIVTDKDRRLAAAIDELLD